MLAQKLAKTAAKAARHSAYVIPHTAEVPVLLSENILARNTCLKFEKL
jgi:hypothetical protein